MFNSEEWLKIKGELSLDKPDTFVRHDCIETIEVNAEVVEEAYLAITLYMKSGNVVKGWVAKEMLE